MTKIEDTTINKELEEFNFEKINSFEIKDLIKEPSEEITNLASKIADNTKNSLSNYSEQQVKFYNDCSQLIFGELIDNNPILIPAKCGFGKTTFLKSMISTVITEVENKRISEEYLPMIITQERLEDLESLVNKIRDEHGYYEETEKIDYLYLFKSWNETINCLNTSPPKNWQESLIRCNSKNCKNFWYCELSNQMEASKKSPIIAFSTKKLGIITDSLEEESGISNYLEFITKNKKVLQRSRLIVDEKPNFLINEEVTIKTIDNLKSYVNSYNTINRKDVFSTEDEFFFEEQLINISKYLLDMKKKLKDYPFYIFSLNKKIFSEEFEHKWFEILGYKNPDFFKLKSLFENNVLWNKNKRSFTTLHINNFNVNSLKTFIFDGTADNSLEYSFHGNNFKFLNIQDYKRYEHLNFFLHEANFSRYSLEKKPKKFDFICEWINKNFKEKVYVITYQHWISKLEGFFKDNLLIQKEKNGDYPYFGNTKGKNTWKECSKMVQIGWNRYDSTTYIAEFLTLNPEWTVSLKEKLEISENKEEIIKLLETNFKGNFHVKEINDYSLKKIEVDFEQEVFRTQIREFNSDTPVDIHIFLKDQDHNKMKSMITKKFPNCNIIKTTFGKEIKLLSNKRNENLKNMFYFLDNEWKDKKITVKALKERFKISDKKWSEQFTGKAAEGISMFTNRGIEIKKVDNGYVLNKK